MTSVTSRTISSDYASTIVFGCKSQETQVYMEPYQLVDMQGDSQELQLETDTASIHSSCLEDAKCWGIPNIPKSLATKCSRLEYLTKVKTDAREHFNRVRFIFDDLNSLALEPAIINEWTKAFQLAFKILPGLGDAYNRKDVNDYAEPDYTLLFLRWSKECYSFWLSCFNSALFYFLQSENKLGYFSSAKFQDYGNSAYGIYRFLKANNGTAREEDLLKIVHQFSDFHFHTGNSFEDTIDAFEKVCQTFDQPLLEYYQSNCGIDHWFSIVSTDNRYALIQEILKNYNCGKDVTVNKEFWHQLSTNPNFNRG